jgi:hypothetical protein
MDLSPLAKGLLSEGTSIQRPTAFLREEIQFRFGIKASRLYYASEKAVGAAKSSIKSFRAIEPIADRTAAVLFQLPPLFGLDTPRLRQIPGKDAVGLSLHFRIPASHLILRGGLRHFASGQRGTVPFGN